MDNINDILNKYFDGESSIDEERLLSRYFQSSEVKEEHKIYTSIFQHFAEEKEINKTVSKPVKKRKVNLYLVIASCAAMLAGVLIFNLLQQTSEIKSVVYVDGKRIENIDIINSEALNSIMSIEDEDTDILESQIDLLESFTQ